MNFIETETFKKAYRSLSEEAKNQVKKTLRLMAVNIRYPSLHTKRIKGTKDIWKVRVSLDYRLTFQIIQDYFILRNVGRHDPTLKNP